MEHKIPTPLVFNPYKHHYNFIKRQIEKWKSGKDKLMRELLLKIGNNQLDLYTGTLSMEQVCAECLDFLTNINVLSSEEFYEWLKPRGFDTLTLSDQSSWIVKISAGARYVHLHPAKNSKHVIRVRSTTLKTVIALKTKLPDNPTLEDVNIIRTSILNLPPVKKLEHGKGILRLFHLFD